MSKKVARLATMPDVQAAKVEAKQEAVAAVKGPDKTQVVVGQPAVDVPTVADLFKELEAFKKLVPTLIAQGTAGLATAQALVDGLAGKANTSALAGLATTTALAQGLAGKVDTATLNGYATTQALTDGLAGKATTAAVQAAQTAADTQKGRVDTILNTTVPGLQTDINTRLLRAGDTATGMLKVPMADATTNGRTAAPRFEQVLGGINQPIRLAQNVGITPVPFDPINDGTGLNRKAMPFAVSFVMLQAPPSGLLGLVGASVTLKIGTTSGGSEIYSKTISASALNSLLNKLTASELPGAAVDLNPGTVLYATVTPSSGTDAGKWRAVVTSVFIPNAS